MDEGSLNETWETSTNGKEGQRGPTHNLDSTALQDVTNNLFQPQRDLTLSPILRPRSPKYYQSRSTSSLLNEETNEDELELSQFPSNNEDTNLHSPSTSTPSRNRTNGHVYNPFEKHLAARLLHNTMSPSLFDSLENMPPTPQTPCTQSFAWSIEQMALLKPAEITDEDITNSALSPDPLLEAQYRAAADAYWNSGIFHVPSPDGPRPVFIPKTPLADLVRIRAAQLAAAAGSMSKAQAETPVSKVSTKRRNSSLRSASSSIKRHCATQTACTIGPNVDFDFASVLGECSVFTNAEVEAGEEYELNSSVGSLRRRLFAEDPDDSFFTDNCSPDCSKHYADLDGSSHHERPEDLFPDLSPIRAKQD